MFSHRMHYHQFGCWRHWPRPQQRPKNRKKMRRLLLLMVLSISHQVNGGDLCELWGIVKMRPYPVPLTNSSILYPPIFTTIGHISPVRCSMGKRMVWVFVRGRSIVCCNCSVHIVFIQNAYTSAQRNSHYSPSSHRN